MYLKLLILSVIIIILNIPFGYWRSNVKRFTLQWILAVHIPVIIVIALRFLVHVGFAWYTFVFLITAFFLGQNIGAYIHNHKAQHCDEISSCLFMDIFRKNC